MNNIKDVKYVLLIQYDVLIFTVTASKTNEKEMFGIISKLKKIIKLWVLIT